MCINPHFNFSPSIPVHTWLRILAVRLDVIAACLGEDDVIAEVSHLHELVVEDLVLAGLAGDVVLLLLGGEARGGGGAQGGGGFRGRRIGKVGLADDW